MAAEAEHGGARPAALVTGASGGIGRALATQIAAVRTDQTLVLVARRADELARVADDLRARHGARVETIAADLSLTASPDEVLAAVAARGLAIETLVNNAGFAGFGPFAETDLGHELGMIQVNIAALTHLTKGVLPGMLERRRGRILNLASTAAFLPGPLMAVYYASKAYVLSFSEALAEELRGTGVTVTALCPGPTATGFQERAAMEESKLIANRQLMDAAEVARIGYAAMVAGQRLVVPGRRNALLVQVPRLLPRAILPRLIRRAQERGDRG